ncbi:MAG: magnesium/cobalt transporter CorA [Myxococcales bacterium]|nr:magnesium/cobalt transporter CorA [Myxococcales bacterium]
MPDEAPPSLRKVAPTAALFLKRNPPVGARPGALAIHKDSPKTRIRVMAFDEQRLNEVEIDEISEIRELMKQHAVTWVDVQGLGDERRLRELGDLFALHPLALADVVNVPQRPKTDSYEGQQLFICGMLHLDEHGDLSTEQVSLFIGKGYLLTFQERAGDVFDSLRTRLRDNIGLLRASGADHLAYAIIDRVVDGYYPVLEAFADELEALEERVMQRPRPALLVRVHEVKRTLLLVRRAVWPLRDALSGLIRDPVPMVTDSARMYLRDTYDHCLQISEMAESYRELVSELTNTYMSVISNRTNDVMRLLTVVTTIFIPLTFIVGVYGMNFDNMPELRFKNGYFITLGAMAGMGALMLIYFRVRGWLGDPDEPLEPGDDLRRRE